MNNGFWFMFSKLPDVFAVVSEYATILMNLTFADCFPWLVEFTRMLQELFYDLMVAIGVDSFLLVNPDLPNVYAIISTTPVWFAVIVLMGILSIIFTFLYWALDLVDKLPFI